MTEKLKEHDFVRFKETGERGTIVCLRADGSCVVELSSSMSLLNDVFVDELEKEHNDPYVGLKKAFDAQPRPSNKPDHVLTALWLLVVGLFFFYCSIA